MIAISIRPVREDDLPDLHRMVTALAAHHGDVATLTLDALRDDTIGESPWLYVLVAQVEGLVGYAALCPMTQLQFGVRGMDMHHLFVRADMRRCGVGRALIDASMRLTRDLGCRFMTVGTHPENAEAAKVYLAAGFDPLPPSGPRFRIKF